VSIVILLNSGIATNTALPNRPERQFELVGFALRCYSGVVGLPDSLRLLRLNERPARQGGLFILADELSSLHDVSSFGSDRISTFPEV
jgi:hypothetical protein